MKLVHRIPFHFSSFRANAIKQQQQQPTTCQGRHLIPRPRHNQHDNQPDLHNNNNKNKKEKYHGSSIGEESKNWL
jgi:hypothetical protein